MATFDFKTATPVTSGLTDSHFYFGAASQSASTPEIYTLLALKTYILAGVLTSLTVGTTTITSGTTTRVLYDNAGVLGEYAISGTGSVAMTNSPTFVTPALGTPASGTLTNATGLPLTTGVTGNLPVTNLNSGTSASASTFWRGDGTWAAAGTVSSVAQTFTGGLISVSGSPITSSGTLALTVAGTSGGIPYFSSASAWASSGALTANALVIGGGAGAAPSTTTTASGILTFLGTPSSANLASAITDETGSGSLVFATSPTLVTPTLGVATATSINKMTITAPATSSTLTVADGKTHVVSNSLTFTGTDSTSFAFPTTSDTVAVLGIAQNFTAAQTALRSAIGTTSTDGIVLSNTTAAAAGAQQYSPRLHWIGQGWKTNATAASQTVDFISELQPVQAAANPTGKLVISSSVNGGAYTEVAAFRTNGSLAISNSNGGIYYDSSGVRLWAMSDCTSIVSTNLAGIYASYYGAINAGNRINLLGRTTTLGFEMISSQFLAWSNSTTDCVGGDTFIGRAAAGSIQLGNADAASPVSQAFYAQSVVAGTSNTAGTDWTFNASRGTGTAAGGKIILKTAPAGATGTSQNSLVAAITLTAPSQRGGVTQQPSIVLGNAALATADTDGYVYIPTCSGTPTGVPTTFTGRVAIVYDTSAHQFWIYDGAWLQPKTPAAAAIVTWQ